MRRWKPTPGMGLWIGLGLLVLSLIGAGVVWLRLTQLLVGPPERWPIDLKLYGLVLLFLGLLVITANLVYRCLAVLTLRYDLDRNGLYVRWLGNRAVVPLNQIETVDIGVDGAQLPLGGRLRLGYYWGEGRTADGRRLHLFSTLPIDKSLAVHTADAAYIISPANADSFVQDLEQRRNLGATQSLSQAVEPSRIFLYAFWNDKTVRRLLLVALVLNLLVLALLVARYPSLGAQVQMRFNATGQVAELRPRHQALFLPLAAFGLTLLNTALGLLLYHRQRLGARLLQGTSVVIQILFAIAVITIVS